MEITQTPNSSIFSGYSYDENAWILSLYLKNGKVYEYTDFGPEHFDEFVTAKSLGTHYNTKIKGVFESREVTPEGVSDTNGSEPNKVLHENLQRSVVADQGITDEEIRRVHPNYEPVAEVLSPEQQAIAVMAPKNPKADELTQRAHALAAQVIVVTNAATQSDMESHLVQLATVRKALFAIVEPYREIAYRAYAEIQQRNKSLIDPIDVAMQTKKGVLTAYIRAEQEKAAAEQRRIDREQQERAEKEQRERTERLRLEVAEGQAAEGDMAGAEVSLFDQAINAPPVYTPPARVEVPTSALGKVRENWKVEVTNLDEVILDVAKGIEAMRTKGNLQGHAPSSILVAHPPALKSLGTANKKMFNYPGLRCWDDGSVAVRTAKE